MFKPIILSLSCAMGMSAFALSNNIELSSDGIFVSTGASSISSDYKKDVAMLGQEAASMLAVPAEQRTFSPFMNQFMNNAQASYKSAGKSFNQNVVLRDLVVAARRLAQ